MKIYKVYLYDDCVHSYWRSKKKAEKCCAEVNKEFIEAAEQLGKRRRFLYQIKEYKTED